MGSTRSWADEGREGDDCRHGASVLSRVPEGVIRYCERCGEYAVEFGTLLLKLTPSQLSRFLDVTGYLLSRQGPQEIDRRFGLTLGRSSATLMLDAEQLVSFHTLLTRAVDRAMKLPVAAPPFETSEIVN